MSDTGEAGGFHFLSMQEIYRILTNPTENEQAAIMSGFIALYWMAFVYVTTHS